MSVGRCGDVVWASFEDLRFEVSEHDPIHRTHLLRVLQADQLIHIDRLDLASARGRFGAVRAFKTDRRGPIDQVLIALEVEYRACEVALRDEQEPILLNGADVRPEPLRWLWPGRVARRVFTLFEGDPGLGKSLATLDLAARLSVGAKMPDGQSNPFDGPVASVLLSAEDEPADTILPRFLAAGGNPRYLTLVQGVKTPSGERVPNLADVPALRRALERTGGRLLIVDPLAAYVPPNADAWRDDVIRRLLMPVRQAVSDLDAGLVAVRHLTKNNKAPAIYRGQASIGLAGAARAVFVFGKDPADASGKRRLVATVKFNIGPEPPTLAYETVSHYGEAAHVSWAKGSVKVTADELLNPPSAQDSERTGSSAEARRFLEELLAAQAGPLVSKDVFREAGQAAISRYALLRAKDELGLVAHRDGPDGGWRWHAPKHEESDASTPNSSNSSHSSHSSSLEEFEEFEETQDFVLSASDSSEPGGDLPW
jgi:AAA domain